MVKKFADFVRAPELIGKAFERLQSAGIPARTRTREIERERAMKNFPYNIDGFTFALLVTARVHDLGH